MHTAVVLTLCMPPSPLSCTSTSPFFEPNSTLQTTAPQILIGDGTTQPVNATTSGLPGGQYYVRLVVVQDPGTPSERPLYGTPQAVVIMAVTTSPTAAPSAQPTAAPSVAPTVLSPMVGTGEATLLDDPANSVQLNGYFTYPAGTNVTSYFDFGPCPLDSTTSTTTTPVTTTATGVRQATTPAVVSGLVPGDYCYRTVLETTDASGNPVKAYGDPSSFQVNGPPDVEVLTSDVTDIDKPPGSATLNGEVIFPTGTPIQYYFEYRYVSSVIISSQYVCSTGVIIYRHPSDIMIPFLSSPQHITQL